MASLGKFGTVRDEVCDTFEYFDNEIRVNPNLSELDVLDFMENAVSIDLEDPEAILVVKGFLRALIHPEDFTAFWQAAREHRQRVEDVQMVAKAIIEAVTGRPTTQPSGSSRGLPTTGPKSRGVKSNKVLARLDGRPDLQLAVVKAQEARHAV